MDTLVQMITRYNYVVDAAGGNSPPGLDLPAPRAEAARIEGSAALAAWRRPAARTGRSLPNSIINIGMDASARIKEDHAGIRSVIVRAVEAIRRF